MRRSAVEIRDMRLRYVAVMLYARFVFVADEIIGIIELIDFTQNAYLRAARELRHRQKLRKVREFVKSDAARNPTRFFFGVVRAVFVRRE